MRLRVVVPVLTVAISSSGAALGQAPGTAPPTPVRPVVGILLVGSTIYSIIDAPLAAHRHNRRAARFGLMPAPVSGPDRSVGLGLHLGATF